MTKRKTYTIIVSKSRLYTRIQLNSELRIQNAELGIAMKKDNIIASKSFDFAVRIVKLCQHLRSKNETVLSKQLLRSGTSIGANVSEAMRGQSDADFISKLNIALKEANETDYWIKLLHRTDYLTDKEYASIDADANEIIAILVSIIKTMRDKQI